MEPDNTTRDAAMARLEAFIGRIYAMDLSEGVWTLLRDSADFTPLEFAQRYTGTFSPDGQRIGGRWESAQDGVTWELDFHLNYTKVS